MHKLTRDSSQTTRLEDRIENVATMLGKIHEWFEVNLKEPTLSTQAVVSVSQTQNVPLQDLSFELYTKADQNLTLLCDHASLHPKWNEKHYRGAAGRMTVSEHLFMCCCPKATQNNSKPPHQEKLAAYGCGYCFFRGRRLLFIYSDLLDFLKTNFAGCF